MPNLLGWCEDQDTKQFGAMVQLNARTFQPQADGTMNVLSTPRTEFFDKDRIDHMASVAGEKSRGFWENVEKNYPFQKTLYENGQDMTAQNGARTIDVQRNRAVDFNM